jgi:hypothetical protein
MRLVQDPEFFRGMWFFHVLLILQDHTFDLPQFKVRDGGMNFFQASVFFD